VDILFFSRGRGRGHVIRDLAIAQALRDRCPTLRIGFASYSRGIDVLRETGEVSYDLMLPENNPYPETIVRAATLMGSVDPSLVVAQEEPGAITAAAVAGIRSIFTTHWFAPRDTHISSQALVHAASILFMEERGIFAEPVQAVGRVHYCGPVLRHFRHHPSEAGSLRMSLGLMSSQCMVLVLPGSPSEEREPIFELVTSAFYQLRVASKKLLWVAGDDYTRILARCNGLRDVEVIASSSDIDRLILACDVVINKGTYNITRESMALGKPSLSLTHSFNAVDDLYAARWPNSKSVRVTTTNGKHLAKMIEQAMRNQRYIKPEYSLLEGCGATEVARRLFNELQG